MKSRCVEYRRARPLLGTIVEITLLGASSRRCEDAFDHAFTAIGLVQRKMSFHDSGSMLSRINSEAAKHPVVADGDLVRVLRKARLFYSLSNGIFDPTIAPHLERAGFLPKSNPNPSPKMDSNARSFQDSQPSDAGTTKSPASASFDDVELLPRKRVRFRQPGIRLDLGGIAKGFAVDQAVSVLRERGIESGLVNAGGDLRAFGPHSFAVGVRDPHRLGHILTSVLIKNRALATSAHYFADRLKPGATVGPFVDPRFGWVRGELASVSVAAKDALTADALTKIVMLDPDNSLPILRRFAAESLVYTPEGAIFSTPNWNKRFQNAA